MILERIEAVCGNTFPARVKTTSSTTVRSAAAQWRTFSARNIKISDCVSRGS